MKKLQQGVTRYILIFCGCILVVIGLIGVILPGLPTTIFLIAAAACFAKSSPRLHDWLLEHPWFGSIIKNWQETRSIPRKAKRLALIMMMLAAVYSWFMIPQLWLKLSIVLIMIFPAIYVYRLPLSEDVMARKLKNQLDENSLPNQK